MRPAVDALPDASLIDSTARALLLREHVQGLALAVIDNGTVVHVAPTGFGTGQAIRPPPRPLCMARH